MPATPKRIKLIEDMQTLGAPIPECLHHERLDFSMCDSVEQADAYIKNNIKYYRMMRAKSAHKIILNEMSDRMDHEEWRGHL